MLTAHSQPCGCAAPGTAELAQRQPVLRGRIIGAHGFVESQRGLQDEVNTADRYTGVPFLARRRRGPRPSATTR